MQYLEFVESRIQNPEPAEAGRAVIAVFETLGERVSGGEGFGLERIFRRVSEKEGVDANEATDHATAVMKVLSEAISSGELSEVRSHLPREFYPLLQGQDFRVYEQ